MSVWVVGTLKSWLVRWNSLDLEWKFSEWKRGGAGALLSLARTFHWWVDSSLQHNSMVETMTFFNVGLRCGKVQKASWLVEIHWNWNGSSANEKGAVLGLWVHQLESSTGELIPPAAQFDDRHSGVLQCRFELSEN
jgi:hypothetical protein